jgi:hypothetical protein
VITRYYTNVQDAEVFAGAEGPFVLWTDHVAEVCKLRDKLLEIAKNCDHCGGTGMVPVKEEHQAAFGRVIECDECEDLRELLA